MFESEGIMDTDTESEIVQNIKDICLEIEDIGFNVNIATTAWSRLPKYIPNKIGELNFLEINKRKNNGDSINFKWADIDDFANRIIDYMNMNGYNSKILITQGLFWTDFDVKNILPHYRQVRIKFQKREK